MINEIGKHENTGKHLQVKMCSVPNQPGKEINYTKEICLTIL